MFNPTQTEVRNFFFSVYNKHKYNVMLTELEKIALSIILEHPEYDNILLNKDKYLNHQWCHENNEVNPFLHMSLHISIIEQILINHPPQINELYKKLSIKYGNEHQAAHQLMDCLTEMLWQSQYNNSPLDIELYLNCIQNKLIKY